MKTIATFILMLCSFLIQAQNNKKENNRDEIKITQKLRPLLIVDGVKISNVDFNQKNTFPDIKSEDIETVSVVKGDSAIIKYGEAGRDGVILIITKGSKRKKYETLH